MLKMLFYVLVVIVMVALLRQIFSREEHFEGEKARMPKFRFRSKTPATQAWVQVYDTDSLEEIKSLQARLEEEELQCFIYEQGRKDIHGNPLKGFGIAVPRSSVPQAQKIIARMPT